MKNITNRKTINTTMLAIIIGFILLSILIYQTVRVVYPYVEMNEDNSSCEVMDSVNVLKCHGADNIGTISSDANVRLDSITHWRNNSNQLQQNPNIFNVSFDYLKDICYPFPNNNEEIFGIRVYILQPLQPQDEKRLLIVPTHCYIKDGTRIFEFGKISKEGYRNIYNNCKVVYSNGTPAETLNENEAKRLITENATGPINSYFLGRNLIFSNILTVDGNFLKLELIKRNDCKMLSRILEGFLLQSVSSASNAQIDIALGRTYYSLAKSTSGNCNGTQSTNGAACVKPCPDNCPPN